MKKGVFGISIIIVLLILPVAFAGITTINVKTFKEHDVILKTLDPYPQEGESNLLEFFEGVTDDNGDVSFESRTSENIVNIVVIVEKGGVRKKINDKTLHMFNKKYTGGTISLEVLEKPPEPIPIVNETEETVNETIEEAEEETEPIAEEAEEAEQEEVIENIEQEESGKITGFSISNTTKSIATSKITYYILGVLIVGVVIIFITRKKLKSKKGGAYIDFKIKPSDEPRILDAERKIQEAKQELDDIKNRKKKLEEAKEKFEKDKKELEELERD